LDLKSRAQSRPVSLEIVQIQAHTNTGVPISYSFLWLFAGQHMAETRNCYIFIVNIMAISVGNEFETYESFKCKIEEIPAYSIKLLICKLVTI